jgi:hypothetical protein
MAEFIRQAVAEKIERESTGEPEPETRASDQIELLFAELDTQRREASEQIETLYKELAHEKRHAGKQLETMLAELAALRQAIHAPIPESGRSQNNSAVTAPPPTLPEQRGTITSRGIDMSRPRPRQELPRAPVQTVQVEELSEKEKIRLAKLMAESIRRANPGRSG